MLKKSSSNQSSLNVLQGEVKDSAASTATGTGAAYTKALLPLVTTMSSMEVSKPSIEVGQRKMSEVTIKVNNDDQDPIAECFENATVLFADIVGFKEWCSSRPPRDVFDLLESLFADFDKCAVSRGVFKVETIGDW